MNFYPFNMFGPRIQQQGFYIPEDFDMNAPIPEQQGLRVPPDFDPSAPVQEPRLRMPRNRGVLATKPTEEEVIGALSKLKALDLNFPPIPRPDFSGVYRAPIMPVERYKPLRSRLRVPVGYDTSAT